MNNGRVLMEERHETRDGASLSAARHLATSLRRAFTQSDDGRAGLIVSGGTTPERCFRYLSAEPVGWSQVVVSLSDERCVEASHPDSNAALVRRHLLQREAAKAQFVPLYRAGSDPCQAASVALASVPHPYAASLLGMGTDGHFASLFPDSAVLEQALQEEGGTSCVLVDTAASPHRRISLTLAELLRCREITLLFFGADKYAVLERARKPASTLPVAALLRQRRCPLRLIWAP